MTKRDETVASTIGPTAEQLVQAAYHFREAGDQAIVAYYLNGLSDFSFKHHSQSALKQLNLACATLGFELVPIKTALAAAPAATEAA